MRFDRIWHNARLATLSPQTRPRRGRKRLIAATAGRIAYAGSGCRGARLDAPERIDCEGRWITPGLIDCHTHLVHGGDRARIRTAAGRRDL
jgi:imidazolonepropionase